jgi:hypothetical protein
MDSTRPVCFSFTKTANGGHSGPPHGDETTALPEGRYEFYVAAYDPAADADGPASAHVALDITGGNVNQFPVAKLSLNPDFAGAPAVITLDASLSSDPDGSIMEYQWDFDGNGTVDWSTADAVPASCCGGEVDTITPGPGSPPMTVTVTYERTAGYADYLYPRVTVVDDKGAIAARSAKLGMTGWEIVETLYSNKDEFNPPEDELFCEGDFGFEPVSGDLAVAGAGVYSLDFPDFYGADMYWWRRAPGDWNYQYIRTADTPLPDNYAGVVDDYKLFWDADGQPMVVMTAYIQGFSSFSYQTYLARRSITGQWTVTLLYAGTLASAINGYRGAAPESIVQTAPGELALLEYNFLDNGNINPHFFDYQYVTYKDGVISVEPTGWPEVDGQQNPAGGLFLNPVGEPTFFLNPITDIDPMGIWQRRKTAPDVWVTERLDHGELTGMADNVYYRDPCWDQAGRLVMGASFITGADDGIGDFLGLLRFDDGVISCTSFIGVPTTNSSSLTATQWGLSMTFVDLQSPPNQHDWYAYHILIQPNDSIVTERPFLIKKGEDAFAGFQQVLQGSDVQLYAVIQTEGGSFPGAVVYLLMRRVDPRGTP